MVVKLMITELICFFFLGLIINDSRFFRKINAEISTATEKYLYIISEFGIFVFLFSMVFYMSCGYLIGSYCSPLEPAKSLYILFVFFLGLFLGEIRAFVLGTDFIIFAGILLNWSQEIFQIVIAISISIFLLTKKWHLSTISILIGVVIITVLLESIYHSLALVSLLVFLLRNIFYAYFAIIVQGLNAYKYIRKLKY